ncbi:hypothetical protein TNCV_454641 [Trichonephila clavipes]|nr:hypothetical protein TNCV_454641 [Trichonephila clavipes]
MVTSGQDRKFVTSLHESGHRVQMPVKPTCVKRFVKSVEAQSTHDGGVWKLESGMLARVSSPSLDRGLNDEARVGCASAKNK